MLTAANPRALALKAKLFRGFADPSRLAILEALRAGPHTAGQVVEATGRSQSNASNHLACLVECGRVDRVQRGRFVRYRLSDERVEALLGTADALLADVARGVYECTRYGPEPTRFQASQGLEDADA